MKSIPLKTLPDTRYPGAVDIEYATVLREVIRRPLDPQKGVQIAEMKQSLRVLDALDAARSNSTLELEDADYQHLKQKLDAMNWNVVDERIIQLVDDVSNA